MKVNIDYNRTAEQIKSATNQFLTRDYIQFALDKAYPNGLKGQQMRMVGRIQRQLDEAVVDNLDEIYLDPTETEFLQDIMEKVEFPATLSKYIVVLQDELKK